MDTEIFIYGTPCVVSVRGLDWTSKKPDEWQVATIYRTDGPMGGRAQVTWRYINSPPYIYVKTCTRPRRQRTQINVSYCNMFPSVSQRAKYIFALVLKKSDVEFIFYLFVRNKFCRRFLALKLGCIKCPGCI